MRAIEIENDAARLCAIEIEIEIDAEHDLADRYILTLQVAFPSDTYIHTHAA